MISNVNTQQRAFITELSLRVTSRYARSEIPNKEALDEEIKYIIAGALAWENFSESDIEFTKYVSCEAYERLLCEHSNFKNMSYAAIENIRANNKRNKECTQECAQAHAEAYAKVCAQRDNMQHMLEKLQKTKYDEDTHNDTSMVSPTTISTLNVMLLNMQIDRLTRDMHDLQNDYSSIEQYNKDLKIRNSDLKRMVARASAREEAFSVTMDKQQSIIEDLQQAVDNYKEEYEMTMLRESDIIDVKKQLEVVEIAVADADAVIEQKNEQIRDLKEHCSVIEKELSDFKLAAFEKKNATSESVKDPTNIQLRAQLKYVMNEYNTLADCYAELHNKNGLTEVKNAKIVTQDEKIKQTEIALAEANQTLLANESKFEATERELVKLRKKMVQDQLVATHVDYIQRINTNNFDFQLIDL